MARPKGRNINQAVTIFAYNETTDNVEAVPINGSGGSATYTAPSSVTPTKAGATVGTSSGEIVAANTSRKTLIITNIDGTNKVYLNFGAAAAVEQGVTLFPNGGTFNMGELDYTTGAVNAIATGAGTKVTIQEW